jgi:multimeric flavodoxin WrbA
MKDLPRIVAICGSTRKSSSNLSLLKHLKAAYKMQCDIEIYDQIDTLPHFNPDLDHDPELPEIAEYRKKLRNAHGILICTPEYAMGVPGTLKNAIDWTVSSMEFSRKPVALITASSMGEKGHASLLETLVIIESEIPEKNRVLIKHIRTKIDGEGRLKEPAASTAVSSLMDNMIRMCRDKTGFSPNSGS